MSNKKQVEIELKEPLNKQSSKNKQQVQQQEDLSNYDIRRSSHPCVCFFHIFFKAGAFFCYLFLGLFISNTLLQYILILLCDALDFYTVKNITGKYLVGLRWYSEFAPNGQELWKFESFDLSVRSKVDQSVFWTFQFGASCAWAFFVFTNLMSFGFIDIIFAFVGASLSWLNLWGFYKSSKDQQKKMKNMKNYLTKQGLKYMVK